MLFFCIIIFKFVASNSNLSCRNGNGAAVDWYVLYKVPRATAKMIKMGNVKNKETFYYADNTSSTLMYKEHSVNDSEGNPLFHTLQQIYDNEPLEYAMYNDQPPTGSGGRKYGHTKGAYAFDDESGFWMISSIPKFPQPKNIGYLYGESQLEYGQTVLCVTVRFTLLQTMNIYKELVSPGLHDSLCVLTWRARLPSTINVYDIREVKFQDNYSFLAKRDHSKWAVTKSLDWTCIGDLNRRKSQYKRGGLTVCLQKNTLAQQFRSLSPCGRRRSLGPRGTCS
ncbi:deoxyribonuclease-2-alpha-like [Saccostrea cucullata]|uniref:deoxyribonuclease-2-alpha-like n=1 Tax=Saccostrea cuccullata TaxID=36930 RepID=UPI002ED15ADB